MLSNSAKRMINKYGEDKCLKAFKQAEEGNGANTIGWYMGYHTNTADALINAGRELEDERAFEEFAESEYHCRNAEALYELMNEEL